MATMSIELDREDASYVPGEPITGRVAWDLDRGSERVVLRLLWQTSGKGTRDTGIVREKQFERVPLRGDESFALDGCDGPYSFSGKLITVQWLLEAYAEPGDAFAERTLTLSPTGEEVRV